MEEKSGERSSNPQKPRENIWQRTLSKMRFRGEKNRGETVKASDSGPALQKVNEEEERERQKRQYFRERGEKIAGKVVELSGDESVREPFVEEYLKLQDEMRRAPRGDEGVEMDNVLKNVSKELATVLRKETALLTYAQRFGVNKEQLELFQNKIFPMIEQRDPEVRPLWGVMAAWAGDEGDWYGTTEFLVETMISKATPANLQKLGMIERMVPASIDKHVKNRADSVLIEGKLLLNHDFIHNEVPGAHEYVHKIVAYYDAAEAFRVERKAGRTSEELKKKKEEAKRELAETFRELSQKYDYYGKGEEQFAAFMGFSEDENVGKPLGNFEERTWSDESGVEVLKRLDKNTAPSELSKPVTGEVEMDEAIGKAEESFSAAGRLMELVNQRLVEKLGKVELVVQDIQLMNYADRVATLAMRGISKKDWMELSYDPGFKEMCRFLEITSQTGEYRAHEFETFFEQNRKVNIEDEGSVVGAYRKLAERRLGHISGFSKSESKFVRENVGLIWSGNLNNEMLRLFEGPARERGKSEKRE